MYIHITKGCKLFDVNYTPHKHTAPKQLLRQSFQETFLLSSFLATPGLLFFYIPRSMLPFPASHNSCLGRASTRERALVAAAFLAAALHDPKGPATAHGDEWEACHDSVDW